MKTASRLFGRCFFLAFALFVAGLSAPRRVDACACCSEEGAHYTGTNKIASYEISLLDEMRFNSVAHLYGGSDVRLPEEYVLNGLLTGKVWKLTLQEGMTSGVLSLSRPSKMTRFTADIHDGRTSAGGGPLLYKEWRFEGSASGTGLFASADVAPTKYILVLQGRGNNSDNSEDFTNWRLQIKGKRETYAFYGEMAKS
jgi:hypothetical protein